MGWELRGDKRYYYRVQRIRGRFCRTYIGQGPAAELAAILDERVRRKRRLAKERRLALESRLDFVAGAAEFITELSQLMNQAVWLIAEKNISSQPRRRTSRVRSRSPEQQLFADASD